MNTKKEECTGCGACSIVCPKNCIQMQENEEGFLEPCVDESLCVKCNRCDAICHIQDVNIDLKLSKNLVAYKNSDVVRASSTSGGFFTLVSDYFLEREKGVVYGARFDNTFSVIHSRAVDKKERELFRGSKYVQSDISGVYQYVKEDLLSKHEVLFTGTPCQIAGLYEYLGMEKCPQHNLLTCDLICHGVASPLIWKNYLDYTAKKYHDQIMEINFRDKTKGWHHPHMRISMRSHEHFKDEDHDGFYQLFYSNCILRPSCHVCHYSRKERVADLTMADCWGIENSDKIIDDNRGCSLVMINSEKGSKVFQQLVSNPDYIDFSIVEQPHLEHPASKSKHRKEFWEEYNSKGEKFVINKYGNINLSRRIRKGAIKIIKHFVR